MNNGEIARRMTRPMTPNSRKNKKISRTKKVKGFGCAEAFNVSRRSAA
jgi:hypothetical protein